MADDDETTTDDTDDTDDTADEESDDDDALASLAARKLRITWDDEGTAARLADLIEDGRAVLADLIGIPDDADFDWTDAGPERALLLDWVFYAWNDATDEFLANYEHDIMRARRKWEVTQYVENTESSS